jgi:aspartate racemase
MSRTRQGGEFFVVKMTKNKGAIAILGGMGPEASAKMLGVLVSMASAEFGARNGHDFPEIIVDSVPIPDFISDQINLNLAFKILTDRTKRLERLNIFCFAIACNTAHIMFNNLSKSSTKPFVSIIDCVVDKVKEEGIKKVGLLATPSTIKASLYQSALTQVDIASIIPTPNEQVVIEAVIRKVIAGNTSKADGERLKKIAKSFAQKGAKGIILGCTELPLVFPKDFSTPVFDSIEILSRKLLTNFYTAKN